MSINRDGVKMPRIDSMTIADIVAVQSTLIRNSVMTTLTYEALAVTKGNGT